MITADHLAEAKAYVDELTNAADFIPGTPEWLEYLTSALSVDHEDLYDWSVELGKGWGSPDTASVQGALITGAVAALFAQRIAERPENGQPGPVATLRNVSGPLGGVGWPE